MADNEVVVANDPETKEEEAEEEEEEDLIDPMDGIREQCEKDSQAVVLAGKLEKCNDRVNSRNETAESCHEEMMDWVHVVDQCLAKTLFNHVK